MSREVLSKKWRLALFSAIQPICEDTVDNRHVTDKVLFQKCYLLGDVVVKLC